MREEGVKGGEEESRRGAGRGGREGEGGRERGGEAGEERKGRSEREGVEIGMGADGTGAPVNRRPIHTEGGGGRGEKGESSSCGVG